LLLVTIVLVTNSLVFAKAQQPQPNLKVDQKISEIKSAYPLLGQESSVKDVIMKVHGLDKDQALKTLAAYHILRNYEEYQKL
jgi:hypothetical protein